MSRRPKQSLSAAVERKVSHSAVARLLPASHIGRTMNIPDVDFDALLLRLEPAYPNSEKRYRQLRLKLVKFFSWRRCEDPESLADETVARVVKNVKGGEKIRSANAYSYVYGIAMNVFREYLRDKKKRDELANNLPDQSPPSPERTQDCREQCFRGLTPDKASLLAHYYTSEDSRDWLAQSFKITLNALRLKVHRIKKELRDCYDECLAQLRGEPK